MDSLRRRCHLLPSSRRRCLCVCTPLQALRQCIRLGHLVHQRLNTQHKQAASVPSTKNSVPTGDQRTSCSAVTVICNCCTKSSSLLSVGAAGGWRALPTLRMWAHLADSGDFNAPSRSTASRGSIGSSGLAGGGGIAGTDTGVDTARPEGRAGGHAGASAAVTVELLSRLSTPTFGLLLPLPLDNTAVGVAVGARNLPYASRDLLCNTAPRFARCSAAMRCFKDDSRGLCCVRRCPFRPCLLALGCSSYGDCGARRLCCAGDGGCLAARLGSAAAGDTAATVGSAIGGGVAGGCKLSPCTPAPAPLA